MPDTTQRMLWWRWSQDRSGVHLAAARRGLDRLPGSVPAMWSLYTELTADGSISTRLRAEHLCLGLYGVHQQSQDRPMHRKDQPLGRAVAALVHSGRFSATAVEQRLVAAAGAGSVEAVAHHLRGLVGLLNVVGQPMDYDRLFMDLQQWQWPSGSADVRRRWGGQYYVNAPSSGSAGDAIEEVL